MNFGPALHAPIDAPFTPGIVYPTGFNNVFTLGSPKSQIIIHPIGFNELIAFVTNLHWQQIIHGVGFGSIVIGTGDSARLQLSDQQYVYVKAFNVRLAEKIGIPQVAFGGNVFTNGLPIIVKFGKPTISFGPYAQNLDPFPPFAVSDTIDPLIRNWLQTNLELVKNKLGI